ncbi:hypothetical protein EDC01DRAFT_62185 [Geopyxis carbonaria]|nr:hypothetical protein EDC01DRAFT_62185 [Geopyxis carbonaria]
MSAVVQSLIKPQRLSSLRSSIFNISAQPTELDLFLKDLKPSKAAHLGPWLTASVLPPQPRLEPNITHAALKRAQLEISRGGRIDLTPIMKQLDLTQGKWLFFPTKDNVDMVWKRLVLSLAAGALRNTAATTLKVATASQTDDGLDESGNPRKDKYVIALYVPNIFCEQSVGEVLRVCEYQLGYKPVGGLEPELYAALNIGPVGGLKPELYTTLNISPTPWIWTNEDFLRMRLARKPDDGKPKNRKEGTEEEKKEIEASTEKQGGEKEKKEVKELEVEQNLAKESKPVVRTGPKVRRVISNKSEVREKLVRRVIDKRSKGLVIDKKSEAGEKLVRCVISGKVGG